MGGADREGARIPMSPEVRDRRRPLGGGRVLEQLSPAQLGAAGVGPAEQLVLLQPVQLLRADGSGTGATEEAVGLQGAPPPPPPPTPPP